MKTKAKSVQVFEVTLWSRKHYGHERTTTQDNIFNGCITDVKSKESVWFRSPAKLMTAIEELYKEAETRTDMKYKQ